MIWKLARTTGVLHSLFLMLKVAVDECKAAVRNPEYKDYSQRNLNKVNFHIRELSEYRY